MEQLEPPTTAGAVLRNSIVLAHDDKLHVIQLQNGTQTDLNTLQANIEIAVPGVDFAADLYSMYSWELFVVREKSPGDWQSMRSAKPLDSSNIAEMMQLMLHGGTSSFLILERRYDSTELERLSTATPTVRAQSNAPEPWYPAVNRSGAPSPDHDRDETRRASLREEFTRVAGHSHRYSGIRDDLLHRHLQRPEPLAAPDDAAVGDLGVYFGGMRLYGTDAANPMGRGSERPDPVFRDALHDVTEDVTVTRHRSRENFHAPDGGAGPPDASWDDESILEEYL